MYTAVAGIYENGQVILSEPVAITQKKKVIVTFLEEEMVTANVNKPREGGWLKKHAEEQGINLPDLPDDFNEPLDELKDYM